MARPKSPSKAIPQSYFTIERKDGGYLIFKITIQDSQVISSERVSEPDNFHITAAKLIQLFRKLNG